MKWVLLGSGMLGLLVACSGKTSSAGHPGTPNQPNEASGPPRDDHTPIGFVPECTRPQTTARTELGSQLQLGSELLRAGDHDCEWRLGAPYELPLSADDPRSLMFQFDVNADGIDDLFFGDIAIGDQDGENRTMVVLTSRVDGQALSFERSACDAPWPTPNRAYFTRDLNGDGILDFVIGRRDGISAVLNLPGSHPEVLHYDFPASSYPQFDRVALLDLAVGDFDADGRQDLAVAYDRTTEEVVYALGVLVFRDRSAAGTYGAPDAFEYAPYSPSSEVRPTLAGYVAAVPTREGAASLYTLLLGLPPGMMAPIYGVTGIPIVSDPPDSPTFIGSTRYGDTDALAIGGKNELHLYDQPEHPPLLRVPSAFEHDHYDHELGGGYRRRGYFLVDVDGDGDEDFVEYGRVSGKVETYDELWIHPRTSSTEFAPAVDLQPTTQPGLLSESPFVSVGQYGKRLLVDDFGASIWPLICAP